MDASVNGEFPTELVDILTRDNVIWQTSNDELETIKKIQLII